MQKSAERVPTAAKLSGRACGEQYIEKFSNTNEDPGHDVKLKE